MDPGAIRQKYGTGKFELIKVDGINDEGAFDDAIKGVSGIVHVATDMNPTAEPEPYILNVVAGTRNLLISAKKEPTVKRIVLTSSTLAAAQATPNVEFRIGTHSYNDFAISKAYEAPYTPYNAMLVYTASKALSEKEAFKWVAEEKPHFAVNTVLPALNFGASLTGELQSTGAWLKMVRDGDYSMLQYVPPRNCTIFYIAFLSFYRPENFIEQFVDVVDDAKIHLGALLHPEVEGERLFACGGANNRTTVLEAIKDIYPDRKFSDGLTGMGHDLSHSPVERALFVLKSHGVDGFESLKQTIKETLKGSL